MKLVGLILRDVLEMGVGIPFHDQLTDRYKSELAAQDEINRLKKLAMEIENKKRQLKTVYLDKIRGYISEELFLETSVALKREISTLTHRYEILRADTGDLHSDQGFAIINRLAPELLTGTDIDRLFLEMFVRKIIILEKDDIKSEQLDADSDLRQILKPLKKGEPRSVEPGLLIIYNLAPLS